MEPIDPNCHSASIEVAVPADTAFAFMADGMKQDHWALGSMNRRALGDGLFVGQSAFDGSDLYIKLVSYPELRLVDYYVGTDPDTLQPTVEARVKPGPVLGRDPDCCVVTLTLWRPAGASDDWWNLEYHVWKTEMGLIKGAIERGL
jgi:hypothetical protein